MDGARVPVYLYHSGGELVSIWKLMVMMTAAVIAGTFAGRAVLGYLNEETFRRVVSGLILVLGVWLIMN